MSLIDDADAGMQPVPAEAVSVPAPALVPAAEEQVTYPFGAPEQIAAPMYPPGYGEMRKCRFCGSVPAADVTFRGHRGIILIMQFLRTSGPMCRDCGLAVFRRMTARTLLQGWWGWLSFFITPLVLLSNLAKRSKVANLAAPRFPAPGRLPASPGKPIHDRWEFVGIAVPVIVVVLIAAGAFTGSG